MTPRTAGFLFWLSLSGLAAAAVVWQLRYPLQMPDLGPEARMSPPELPAPSSALAMATAPPPPQYQELLRRPLFITARRPEPPPPDQSAAPTPTPAGPDQTFRLLGVMMTPEAAVALVRPEAPNARIARLKAGDQVGEWQLEAVFANRVILRKGAMTQEVNLSRPKPPARSRHRRMEPTSGPEAKPAHPMPEAMVPPQPPPLPMPQP